MDDDFTFGVKEGGGADVVIDGEVYEAPLTEGQPLMEELPPAEAAPEDPEVSRLREKADLYDSFEPVLRRLGRGEVFLQEAAPPEPVPPPAEDLAGYFARVQSPHGAAIHERVKAYAEYLPESQRAALETIPSRYNEIFDKLAGVDQPAPQRGPGRDVIEKILAAKESRKDSARAERAGVQVGNRASFPEDRPTGRAAEINRLKKAIKMHPNDQDLATALASYYTDGL